MAKITLDEAAKVLGMHPLTVAYRLGSITGEFSDCWPFVDPDYVETLKSMGGTLNPAPVVEPRKPVDRTLPPPPPEPSFSNTAVFVVEKLYRKGRWGKMSVSLPSLRHMCGSPKDLVDAVEELQEAGLLLVEGKDKAFSLNPDRKGDIEAIGARHGWKKG